VKSCYAIVPVLPGGRALVDVSRSSATYLVPWCKVPIARAYSAAAFRRC